MRLRDMRKCMRGVKMGQGYLIFHFEDTIIIVSSPRFIVIIKYFYILCSELYVGIKTDLYDIFILYQKHDDPETPRSTEPILNTEDMPLFTFPTESAACKDEIIQHDITHSHL